MRGSAVDRLLAATAGLDCERIFEPSVKLSRDRVSTDRGLVSVPRAAVNRDTIARICADLGAETTPGIISDLPAARAVHFGVDDGIGKLYLEFGPGQAPDPNLVFVAAKWRGPEQSQDRYHSLTHLSSLDLEADITQGLADPALQPIMSALLDRARWGDPDGEAVVLKVTQTGSVRLSYDVSLADGGYSVAQSCPMLESLFAVLGRSASDIPAAAMPTLLGHVAVGHDADGATFVTLYCGARAL